MAAHLFALPSVGQIRVLMASNESCPRGLVLATSVTSVTLSVAGVVSIRGEVGRGRSVGQAGENKAEVVARKLLPLARILLWREPLLCPVLLAFWPSHPSQERSLPRALCYSTRPGSGGCCCCS